jgi:hypothetical protein
VKKSLILLYLPLILMLVMPCLGVTDMDESENQFPSLLTFFQFLYSFLL